MVTGRVRNMRQLGPFIHRLCYGKETYRLRRRSQRRREFTLGDPKSWATGIWDGGGVVITRVASHGAPTWSNVGESEGKPV